MKILMMLVLSHLVAIPVLSAEERDIFYGIPTVKYEISIDGNQETKLSSAESLKNEVRIVKIGQDYVWKSRGNRKLIYTYAGHGDFHYFIDPKSGGYVKINMPSSGKVAFFEHISLGLATVTYYGNSEVFNPNWLSSPSAEEHNNPFLTVEAPNRLLQISALDWTAMQDEEIYAKNFQRRHKLQNELFEQVVTVFLIPMSPERRIGTKISDNEYIDFFSAHQNSVTILLRLEKNGYWILSRQTFVLNGQLIKYNYNNEDIERLQYQFKTEIEQTKILLSQTF
jgi:hypothetical protein